MLGCWGVGVLGCWGVWVMGSGGWAVDCAREPHFGPPQSHLHLLPYPTLLQCLRSLPSSLFSPSWLRLLFLQCVVSLPTSLCLMSSALRLAGVGRPSKLKGRVYERGSAQSVMGAEAQQLHSRKRQRTGDKEKVEEAEDGSEVVVGEKEGVGEAEPTPPLYSDTETSEDEEDTPPTAVAVPPRTIRPTPAPSRGPSLSSPPLSSPPPSSSSPSPFVRSTVTVAVAGSIIANAQSPELRSYLAGQIARSLTVFCVDRVVVFRDSPTEVRESDSVEGEWRGAHRGSDPSVFLARVLQFLECPQYLRKFLFPVHADLRYAGLLNPLDAPHHVRGTEFSPWREGVVVKRPAGGGGKGKGGGSWANVGLLHDIQLDRTLPPLTRVTVQMVGDHTAQPPPARLQGRVVSPERPREGGKYWGYEVEVCPAFSDVLTSCAWTDDGRYDLTIGTSERGQVIPRPGDGVEGKEFKLPAHRHLLVVFGGLQGLEECCASDEKVTATSVESMFDLYLNSCAEQGSRTIRTEEAILITLSLLRPHILHNAQLSHRTGKAKSRKEESSASSLYSNSRAAPSINTHRA